MICVRGPSIFHGYLGIDNDPFVEIEGEKYYQTGDLGYVDNDGYLFITGRLKRFLKIGGEMISLPFLENILLETFGIDEEMANMVKFQHGYSAAARFVSNIDEMLDVIINRMGV